jgi:hypothetical protein
MKIKVSQLFKVVKLIQQMQKEERAGKIKDIDTDIFIAEEWLGIGDGIRMTFKYFKNDGTEQMASILINDKPLNHFMYEENRKAVNNG